VGDPILFTDNVTGRTFVSQEESAAGSTTDVTDDDGETFQPSQGAGAFSGFDHQTIASGPYRDPIPVTAMYPATGRKRAVYYAAQNVADARISRSDDGGITFLPSIPMYTTADCGGLHGHIKVTPETPATVANGHVGTVYVPNNACGGSTDPIGHSDGQQAAIVSEDNGITWSIREIPNSDTLSNRDPSIGIATDGTVYFGMQSKDNHARIAVSKDKGMTWTTPVDVGAQVGVVNMAFPEVVAGDPDRAAFAFFGSTTPGTNWNQADFPGVWYLYLSVTYDGGATWTTTNLTPDDPIQRGGICNGTTETCRNLLDFFDATIDKEGRILVAYDDGCVGPCVQGGGNSFTAKAAIARQSGGKRMFAAHDPAAMELPGAPSVSATSDNTGVTLTWPVPDNGGAPITEYKIYRGTVSGGETFLASAGTKATYLDATALPGVTYYYRVTAVNSVGEGPYCGEVIPVPAPVIDPCTLPGVTILTDANGDLITATGTTSYPGYDLRSLSIGEPFGSTFTDKLVFTIKTEGLETVPPSARWPLQFRLPGDAAALGRFVSMQSNASGTVSFKYGTFVVNTGGAYSSTFTTVGDADAESTYDPDGTITIVVSRSKIGNPAPGSNLVGFLLRVRIDPAGVTPDNMPNSLAPEGQYSIVGNEFCRPNVAPLANLVAIPESGTAPLTVNFDASASSDPDTDPITSYMFTFGDDTPDVTQSTPTIQHTYNAASNYLSRVRVQDARGKMSENAAVKMINVFSPGATPTPTPGPPQSTPTPTPTATPGATATPTPTPAATATPTPMPGATPTPSPGATVTPTPTPSATASPTATPTATPTASPTASPARLLNISSRVRVQTGDNVLIGGFIVDGLTPKRILLRAIGPSIKADGAPLPGRLADPVLEMYNEAGQLIASNDNWKDSLDKTEIENSGFVPPDEMEPAISRIIDPGQYTAIVRGKDNSTGIALIEAYDRNAATDSKFANISSRGFVETGDNVLIGGFILGSQTGDSNILVRAIGPSLKPGLPTALNDPVLELYDENGTSMVSNDNWRDAPNRDAIEATGVAPNNDAESAILLAVPPTQYTAIVRGKDGTTGLALIEVYNVE
jgi:hypothetical protein